MIVSRTPSRGRLLIPRRQVIVWACTFGVGVLFLFAWELASRTGTIDSVFYSKPTDIVVRLWQDMLGAEVYGRTNWPNCSRAASLCSFTRRAMSCIPVPSFSNRKFTRSCSMIIAS